MHASLRLYFLVFSVAALIFGAASSAHAQGDVHLDQTGMPIEAMPSAPVTADGVHAADPHAVDAAHGDAHGDGHAAPAGLPQLDPSTYASQVFWLVVMFAVLYLVFSRRVLPAISSTLENRREHVDSGFAEAERLQKEAADVHDAYEKILGDARLKADALFGEIEASIQAKAAKETKAFHERMEKETKLTEARIERTQKDIRSEMDGIVAEVARQAAEKIIGVSADLAQVKSMIKDLNDKPQAA